MAFYKELKESKHERRSMQVKILLVIVVIEGMVWYLSESLNTKIVISILVLAMGAFLIFAQTDYWRIRQWKKGRKRLEKMRGSDSKRFEKELKKKHQANVKKLSEYLPSFSHMEKDATAEEIMRVAALAQTILNLTFKIPVPVADDSDFSGVFKTNNEWAKEQLENGNYKIEAHDELREVCSSNYSESIAKLMMEIDDWNQQMIEHAVLTGTLDSKPAFQCMQSTTNLRALFVSQFKQHQKELSRYAVLCEACDILTINYAHLLLKSTTLPMQNPLLVGDIAKALKQASSFLYFDEGMKFEPKSQPTHEDGKETLNAAEQKESSDGSNEPVKKDIDIDEDRFYFYNDLCSFKLKKEDIKQDNVEKDGMKHTLMTESLGMIVIEIRQCMPYFGESPFVTTKNIEVAGYPCLEASMMGMTRQFYINCGSFVVQVDMVVPSEDFLNSFSHFEKNEVPTQEASFVQNDNIYTVNGVSFEMITVNGSFFVMGAPDDDDDAWEEERPQHQVSVDSYAIGQTQVTQELWEAVMNSNPSEFKGKKRPVENVSWLDCHLFINKLNKITGKSFRLPTEAEWEFAARGGEKHHGRKKYSGSDCIDDVAWYKENSDNQTHDVGTKKPNELGIYDMNGNVAEWCEDSYKDYTSESQINPKVMAPHDSRPRVDRGGGWQCTARECRITLRSCTNAHWKYNCLGLRLAL